MDVAEERFSYNVLEDLRESCAEAWVDRSREKQAKSFLNSFEGDSNMKKNGKMMGKLLMVALFATLILAACGTGQTTSACHATGDETTPYEEIAIDANNLDEHLGHPNDFWPVPVNGCPTTQVTVIDEKIIICHATGSETNPYTEITIDRNGLSGHDKHEGDMIPVPENGCPSTLGDINDGKITICHATSSEENPYNEITVSINGLNGHDKHEGDIIPVPSGGCPTQ